MTSRPILYAKKAKIPYKDGGENCEGKQSGGVYAGVYPSFEYAREKGCEKRQGNSRKGKGSALVFLVIWGGSVGHYRRMKRNILESVSGTQAPIMLLIEELFYEQVVGKWDRFFVFQTSLLSIRDAMYVHTIIFSAENFRV